MENNGHSANVRLWLGHSTWVHIHTRFEEYLLNTSAVINKIIFEQKGMLYQEYQSFGPKQNCQDIVTIGTHYTKRMQGFYW